MFKWFSVTFGFKEYGIQEGDFSRANYALTQREFELANDERGNILITSEKNGKIFNAGRFYTPSVEDLRGDVVGNGAYVTHRHEAITDVFSMHYNNPGATFQAASQFNCLEFGSPHVTPEYGISGYAFDETQGPACALACAAGTLYRNYFFLPPGSPPGECGQSEHCQLNTLSDLEHLLNNSTEKYFRIRNGYTIADTDSLSRLNEELDRWKQRGEWDKLVASVRVGVQADVGVLFKRRFQEIPSEEAPVTVNQIYCSALSCGYNNVENHLWESFAQLILDASYEATVLAALSMAHARCPKDQPDPDLGEDTCHRLFLTFLGGGVFRNDSEWIAKAIGRALAIAASSGTSDLEIVVCHFRRINEDMKSIIDTVYKEELSKRRLIQNCT